MRHHNFSNEDIAFIKANRLKISGAAIAKKVNCDKGVLYRWFTKNNLKVPKELSISFRVEAMKKPFTEAEDRFIVCNLPTSSIKQLSKQMKRTSLYVSKRARELGLGDIIDQKAKDSRIKKGNVPSNKGKPMLPHVYEKAKATMFKKGNVPHNTALSDGVIVTRQDHPERNGGRPTKYIRLALGKWQPLSNYNWEQKFGKVPAGYCIAFIDKNSLNCTLENLELISRAENMRRNTIHNYPDEIKTVIRTIAKLNKTIKNVTTI